MAKVNKKKYHEFFCDIWEIADDIIAMCGIDTHITDIYLAGINIFVDDEKKAQKILDKVGKKYKVDLSIFDDWTPIALIALYILEDKCDCDQKIKL